MTTPVRIRYTSLSSATGSAALAGLGIDNSLRGTLSWARSVVKSDASVQEKSQASLAVCSKAFEARQFPVVVDWAMKAFNYRSSDDDMARATGELLTVANAVYDGKIGNIETPLDDATKQLIREKARVFVQRDLTFALQNLPVKCKQHSLGMIRQLFVASYMPLQLTLSEQILDESEDPDIKDVVAERYLSLARLATQNLRDFELDRDKLREMAEHVVGRLPERVGRPGFAEQGFSTIVVNLGGFELWDLLDRAIAIHPLVADAPLSIYLKLTEKLRHEGPAAAYSVVAEIPDLSKIDDVMVAHELGVQKVRLFRFYVDAHRVSLSEAKSFLGNLTQTGWHRRVLDLPRRQFGAILRQITGIQAALLTGYVRNLNRRVVQDQQVTNAAFEIDTAAHREYLFIWPETEEVEVFIADQETTDERYVKVCFGVADRHKQKDIKVSGDSRFEGVSPAEQDDLPLAWDALTFDRIIETFPPSGVTIKEVAEVAQKIDEAARKLFQKVNQEQYAVLAGKVFIDDKFFDERDELYHRANVCRSMLSFSPQLEDARTYILSPRDFLFPLVREAELIPSSQFKDHFELNGQTGMMGVKFTTGEGEIWGVIKSTKKIEIIGAVGKEVAIADEHLLGLALEALVIARAQEQGIATELGQGMVVSLDGSTTDPETHKGLGQLISIYNHSFRARMMAEGLVSVPWFFKEGIGDDLLYKPLADLSERGKREALKRHGAKNIYIPEAPTGKAVRLRIGPKGHGVDKKIAAYEPTQRSLDQQRYLMEAVLQQQGRAAVDLDVTPRLFYRLYVVTRFVGTERLHFYLVKQSDKEDDVYDDALMSRVDADISSGVYRQKDHLFRKTLPGRREQLKNAPIERQDWDMFTQHRTYERPEFFSLEKLLTDGFPLGFTP
ncbi:MAG: hypothetical protein ABH823_02980 [bacterium]